MGCSISKLPVNQNRSLPANEAELLCSELLGVEYEGRIFAWASSSEALFRLSQRVSV